jgi:hypothetical protein
VRDLHQQAVKHDMLRSLAVRDVLVDLEMQRRHIAQVQQRADELGWVRAVKVKTRLNRLLAQFMAARELDGAEAFLQLLATIPAPDPDVYENDFRDELIEILQDMPRLGVRTQKEVAVPRCSAKLDLHAHLDGLDYLITLKRGFNRQKLKLVKGEVGELLGNWVPTVPKSRVYCVLYAFNVQPGANTEAFAAFDDFAAQINERHGKRFHVRRTSPLVRTRARAR